MVGRDGENVIREVLPAKWPPPQPGYVNHLLIVSTCELPLRGYKVRRPDSPSCWKENPVPCLSPSSISRSFLTRMSQASRNIRVSNYTGWAGAGAGRGWFRVSLLVQMSSVF